MKVDLIDHMGTDLDVVNAARVSFDKVSSFIPYVDADGEKELVLREADRKLIRYLADHNHWSPFSHCYLKFRIKAPIFVARQLQKHTVGLAWNEVSRRYVNFDPEFYEPEAMRTKADNVKQGSGDEHPDSFYWQQEIVQVEEAARKAYTRMIEDGICPEQARMVLPQSMMTEWIWSGSLYAFARVCALRMDEHAQRETAAIAFDIHAYLMDKFPVSTEALLG